jgi:hypothetical protein
MSNYKKGDSCEGEEKKKASKGSTSGQLGHQMSSRRLISSMRSSSYFVSTQGFYQRFFHPYSGISLYSLLPCQTWSRDSWLLERQRTELTVSSKSYLGLYHICNSSSIIDSGRQMSCTQLCIAPFIFILVRRSHPLSTVLPYGNGQSKVWPFPNASN